MRVQSRFDSTKIGELVCDGALKYVQNFAVEIDGERVAEYKSLNQVAMDWKDFPDNPLIGENARELFRKWAKLAGVSEVVAYIKGQGGRVVFKDDETRFAIDIPGWCVSGEVEDSVKYTVEELCREEEE